MRGPILSRLHAERVVIQSTITGEQLDLGCAAEIFRLHAHRNMILMEWHQREFLGKARVFPLRIFYERAPRIGNNRRVMPIPILQTAEVAALEAGRTLSDRLRFAVIDYEKCITHRKSLDQIR